MIIGNDRLQVIKNIEQAANQRDFTAKVELGDPVMTLAERRQLINDYWARQKTLKGQLNDRIGHVVLNGLSRTIVAGTEIKGVNHLRTLVSQGAIITANHFNQLDAVAINRLPQQFHQKMSIVIEDVNLKLPGILSYLMNYIGTIPLINSPSYLNHEFPQYLHQALDRHQWVLIFPEQEMWWNYRKPRKPQRGAYYFAAREGVPIISTFVELQALPKFEKGSRTFHQVKYVIHVLPIIYPNPSLSVDKNSKLMLTQDYQQKVTAYEEVYHRKLNYDFTSWDIAGWQK